VVSTPRTGNRSSRRGGVRVRHDQALGTGPGQRVGDDAGAHGRLISNVGPDDRFYLPTGILNPDGSNTLAIAVWEEQPGTGGLGRVSLFAYGSYTGPPAGAAPQG
jgi:Beta-galactosidase second all-beta domain